MKARRRFHEADVLLVMCRKFDFLGTLGALWLAFYGRSGANIRGFRGVFFIYPDYLISNLTKRVAAVSLWKTDPAAPA